MKWYEISVGLLIIPGIMLIVHVSQLYVTGIILGLLAALLLAAPGRMRYASVGLAVAAFGIMQRDTGY